MMDSYSALSVAERSAIVAVARRFYIEDRSKVEIASELGISRFKVARMLEQARERGIVTITLNDQGIVDAELSREVAERFGLVEAVVVQGDSDPDEARSHVGNAGAELLSRTLHAGEVLGMSWGRTLSAMTETLPSLPRVSVVQLTGTVGSNFELSPVEIVRKVAQNSGGSAHPIYAPMVVDDPATAAALRQQTDVAGAMRMFGDVTTAVLALGSWAPIESQLAEALPTPLRDDLIRRGVVAEVAGTLVSAEGELVAPDFSDLCIAVTAEQLRKIPRVLLVAAGERKAAAAHAIINANLLSGVVVDRALAEALLEIAS